MRDEEEALACEVDTRAADEVGMSSDEVECPLFC